VLTAINLCANFIIEVYHEVLKHRRTERSVVTRDNELEEGEALRRGVNCFISVLMGQVRQTQGRLGSFRRQLYTNNPMGLQAQNRFPFLYYGLPEHRSDPSFRHIDYLTHFPTKRLQNFYIHST